MGLKIYNPTTPSLRGTVSATFEEITKKRPEKSLIRVLKKKAGRNFTGTVTVRHQSGGSKQMLRAIDFKRDKTGVPGRVAAIEYDPTRTARIALIHYVDGEKRYILAPVGLNVGDVIKSGEDAEIKPGNAMPMGSMPAGTVIHNIELTRGKGAQLVRSAGNSAQLMAKEGKYVLLRMPSGEMRRIQSFCYATIGQVGNVEHEGEKLGKAGRSRWLGVHPGNRGKAMSPRDHPHGGGEGRCPIGMPGPKTPWGKPARGYKTRAPHKASDRLIVKRRN